MDLGMYKSNIEHNVKESKRSTLTKYHRRFFAALHEKTTHREVLECQSAAASKCFILLMPAKSGCGAAALLEVIISSSLDIVMVTVSSFLLLSFLHGHCVSFS